VEELKINGLQLTDLTALQFAQSLKQLNIEENRVSSLLPLGQLQNLKKIELMYNDLEESEIEAFEQKIENVTVYGRKLQRHNFNDTAFRRICESDKATLAQKKLLRAITREINKFKNKPLTSCEDLSLELVQKEDFNIIFSLANSEISDLSLFSGLPNLKALDLTYNQIENIDALLTLERLESVNLNYNKIAANNPVIELLLAKNVKVEWNHQFVDPKDSLFYQVYESGSDEEKHKD
jgi:Leucine-rich repeat (LRR) protein